MQTSSPLYTFKDQFHLKPEISNPSNTHYSKAVICGMGGSAISVNLLKMFFPELPITLHNSYGLPNQLDEESTLIIINSYSGETEEALDAYDRAKKDGLHIACLSLGGKLLQKAHDDHYTHITLPASSLEPRFSIGHQMIGILSLLGEHEKITILQQGIEHLDIAKSDEQGRRLASQFRNLFPVLYSSHQLLPVTYLIKAAINEGAKTPCFVSVVPESNHNELQSFVSSSSGTMTSQFGFMMYSSLFDHARIQKRLSIMNEMYTEEGFTVSCIDIDFTSIASVIEQIVTGYFMATYMAVDRGVDPYETPFIARFKKHLTD